MTKLTLEQLLEQVEHAREEAHSMLGEHRVQHSAFYYECLARIEYSLNDAHHWLQEAINVQKDGQR